MKEPVLKKNSGINIKQYGMMIALVVIFLIFSALSNGTNMSAMNINNLIMQNSYVIILAVGMLLCVITGNVDLSVGSVVAFTGAVSATLMMDYNMPMPLVIVIILITGLLIGMSQGFFIAHLGVPPFIITLSGMLIFRGLTMVVLQGQTKGPLSEEYVQLGAGYLPTFMIGEEGATIELLALTVGIVCSAIIIFFEIKNLRTKKKYGFNTPPIWQSAIRLGVIIFLLNFITVKLAQYSGLPVVLLIMTVLVLLYMFITTRMVVGRQIFAVGGNVNAARLSGIKTKQVMFWVYANMGLLCALAGIVLSARNASATPKAGDGFELDAIASCYIGGASAYGGTGTIIGAVVGALTMGVLNNGMSLIGWSVDIQRVVKGLVLAGAVTIDLLSKRRAK
jgi:putative multiple sugar transport system permease protein